MMHCDEVMRQLWEFLDDELTPSRRQAIGTHVALCTRCQPHVEFERAFLRAVASIRQEPSGTETLALRVRDALRVVGFVSA